MARREYFRRFVCAELGCGESANYRYDTKAEARDALQRQQKHPYRCTRHAHPEEVLRPDHTAVQCVMVATPGEGRISDKLFWRREDGRGSGSGFTFGGGYKAHADDFPPGTRLVVTAYVETPEVQALMAPSSGEEGNGDA